MQLLKRTAPMSLLFAGVLFFTAPLIPRIVGRDFSEAVLALRWLCLIPLFRAVHFAMGESLLCSGRQSVRTVLQIIAAAFNLGVNLYLIPRFGWRGAAWSSLATDGGLALLAFVVVTRMRRLHAAHGPSADVPLVDSENLS